MICLSMQIACHVLVVMCLYCELSAMMLICMLNVAVHCNQSICSDSFMISERVTELSNAVLIRMSHLGQQCNVV